MRTTLIALLILAGPASSKDTEKKIKMQDLPPAVQNAVKEHSKGATVVGFAKEIEGGATLYEAEMKVGNRTKDVTFDPEGKVVTVEEETTLDSIPAPARDAILKAIGKHKLLLVESVSEKGATFYEAHYRSGLHAKEIKIDGSGNPVK